MSWTLAFYFALAALGGVIVSYGIFFASALLLPEWFGMDQGWAIMLGVIAPPILGLCLLGSLAWREQQTEKKEAELRRLRIEKEAENFVEEFAKRYAERCEKS